MQSITQILFATMLVMFGVNATANTLWRGNIAWTQGDWFIHELGIFHKGSFVTGVSDRYSIDSAPNVRRCYNICSTSFDPYSITNNFDDKNGTVRPAAYNSVFAPFLFFGSKENFRLIHYQSPEGWSIIDNGNGDLDVDSDGWNFYWNSSFVRDLMPEIGQNHSAGSSKGFGDEVYKGETGWIETGYADIDGSGDLGFGDVVTLHWTKVLETGIQGFEGFTVEYMMQGVVFSNACGAEDFQCHYRAPTVPMPIPASIWLLGTGLLGLAGMRRRLRGVK